MAALSKTVSRLFRLRIGLGRSTEELSNEYDVISARAGGGKISKRGLNTRRAITAQHSVQLQTYGVIGSSRRHGILRSTEVQSQVRYNGMCWSCQRRFLASEREKEIQKNEKPRPKLVESTRKLREQVQSKLADLTPHENIYTIPNILTFSRLLAAPAIGYLVLHDYHAWAVGLFAYAGITDLIDGYLARRWKQQTVVGSVIDPMADKTLMFILTVCLAAKGAIPLYLATLILGRDASLALAAIYYRYASLPLPKTFTRYWDFSLPSAEVHPTTVSKYNTFLQLILLGATTTLPLVTSDSHHMHLGGIIPTLEGADLGTAMMAFQLLVAGTTAWSGLSYAVLKDAVKILGTDEELKKKQGRVGRAVIGVSFSAFLVLAGYFAVQKPGERIKEKREASRSSE
ncbi:MAG: hypothetical protein M1820_000098 [Bogoriella megaspora]|nr:MAG: hypothetical protein M1820_000098 [Bogoriella megaspora]